VEEKDKEEREKSILKKLEDKGKEAVEKMKANEEG
jgi:hypothetical protein